MGGRSLGTRRAVASVAVRMAVGAAMGLAGCGGGDPVPPPAPRGEAVVPRHRDQVCRPTQEAPTTVRISELFDTAGLGRVLAQVGLKPLPLAPPWPVYEFIVRYDVRGRPVAAGTWDATVDAAVAALLEAELEGRIRALPGLLEPTGFRARVRYARRVTFELAGPVLCIPHIAHLDGKRPTGLPDWVTSWGGVSSVRPGDRNAAVVRIHVGPDGVVTSVEDVAGAPEALVRARGVVPLLTFEPALANGVPVPGVFLQGFRFREVAGG